MSSDYIFELNSLFQLPKERRFTDRTQVMDMLLEALTDLNQDSQYYHIFSIHGIGGIGKSRLVKEFISAISPEPVFSLSEKKFHLLVLFLIMLFCGIGNLQTQPV